MKEEGRGRRKKTERGMEEHYIDKRDGGERGKMSGERKRQVQTNWEGEKRGKVRRKGKESREERRKEKSFSAKWFLLLKNTQYLRLFVLLFSCVILVIFYNT